ncbi:MAG: hypothetical protein WD875_13295 [Pirellulales bacterium]
MDDDRDENESEPRRDRDVGRGIRDMVSGLVARCQEKRTRREVYWDMLYTAVETLAANGGAVWEPVSGMPSQLKCAMGCGSQLNEELDGALRRDPVEPFLAHVAMHGTTIVAPPGEGGECSDGSNPTDDLWLFTPIGVARSAMPLAVLHVVQRSGTPGTTQQGYARFMRQLCEIALDGLKRTVEAE